MKRFFIPIFALALFISAAGAAPAAHAAVGSACTLDTDCSSDAPYCNFTTFTCQAAATSGSSAAPVPSAVAPAAGANNPTDFTTNDTSSYGYVMTQIMGLFAYLVGIAMITLDNAMYYTVVHMGSYISGLTAIGTAWRILRDVGNIILIFGFLAIGITVILDTQKFGYSTKMLPMLLVAAVFLNFSLFFSEVIIDAGNLFATEFYTQINNGNPAAPVDFSTASVHNEGVSNAIMSQLGLQTLYGDALTNKQIFAAGNTWFLGFMGVLLFLIAAFVMFSLAFILIARFVFLIFLIVIAPIGFAGLAVPKLSGTASWWWSEIFNQTITAPVLLLLLYVALAVITDAHFLTGFTTANNSITAGSLANSWTGWLSGGGGIGGLASLMLSFLVAMGLLLLVTIVAKKMSAFGADWATKWGGRLSFGLAAYGLSAPINGVSRIGRKTLQRYAPNNVLTRTLSQGLSFGEKARMDIRSVPGVSAGLNLGGAGEAAAAVKASPLTRIDQATAAIRKSSEATSKEFEQAHRIPDLRDAISRNNPTEVGRRLGNLSDKELESAAVVSVLTDPRNASVVALLPQNRFDKLLTSDAVSDAQKTALRTRRETGVSDRYVTTATNNNGNEFRHPQTHPNEQLRNQPVPSISNPGANMTRGEFSIRALSDEAASQLPDNILTNPTVSQNLNGRQLAAIARRGAMSDANATTIGQVLNNSNSFLAYYNGQSPQRQTDLRSFYHLNIPQAAAAPQPQQAAANQQPRNPGAQNPYRWQPPPAAEQQQNNRPIRNP